MMPNEFVLEYHMIQLYNHGLRPDMFEPLPLTVNSKFAEPWQRLNHLNRGGIAHRY
jgi:hypothetical protein